MEKRNKMILLVKNNLIDLMKFLILRKEMLSLFLILMIIINIKKVVKGFKYV